MVPKLSKQLQFALSKVDFELWNTNRMTNMNGLIEMEITPSEVGVRPRA